MSLFSRSLIIASVILLAQIVGLAVPLFLQADLLGESQKMPVALDALASGVTLLSLVTAGVALIALIISFVMGGGWAFLRKMLPRHHRVRRIQIQLQPLRRAAINILGDVPWFGPRESNLNARRRTERR